MACEFRIQRAVEFSETDAAGIVHFSNFFRYMEAAEHAFFRFLGFTVHGPGGGILLGWPRVAAQCEYRQPLRFEDRIEIHLLVKHKGRKSLTYLFIFHRLDKAGPVEVARGELTVVSVAHNRATGRMESVALPDEVAAKLEPAPKDLLARHTRSRRDSGVRTQESATPNPTPDP